MNGKANPLMDRKVVGAVFFEWLQWSPRPQLLDVVRCSVVCSVVVVLVYIYSLVQF
jgi:hypothetical protein